MFEEKTSRRTFLKTSAGVALGLAFANFAPSIATAAGKTGSANSRLVPLSTFNYKSASINNLPKPLEAARQSEMVMQSFDTILEVANKISDSSLRNAVLTMLKDPQPKLADQYTSSGSIQNLYNKLANAGYVKTDTVPLDKLVPPYNGKAPQAFYTAPGSGYHSHHAYPGGLATHVAANMIITESIINTYNQIYGYDAGADIALASQALHDICKPWVFQWQDNGESLKEYSIAGTGSHHIYSVAESMYRGLPAEEIVAQACAHDHPGNQKSEASVVNWIKAAAIIANVDPIKSGYLMGDGNSIPTPHKQAGYIVHLGDHDWVLTSPASQKAEEALKTVALKFYGIDANTNATQFNHFRNFVCAQVSSMLIHDLIAEDNGTQKLGKRVASLVKA